MSAENVARVRKLTNESDTTNYSDADLQTILDLYDENVSLASAQVWREKAAMYADLVDVQEGSSRRALSDLHKQALAMASSMLDQGSTGGGGVPTARTVRITR